MRVLFITLFLVTFLSSSEIRVALSSNAAYVIKPLVDEFKREYTYAKVSTTIGSSGKLVAQIRHGREYDIFISADMLYPEALFRDGFALKKPDIYARGELVYFTTKGVDIYRGLKILVDKDIEKVAVANPKSAPYGRASVEALKSVGIYKEIKDKLIYAESISQALTYTVSAVDFGIVAKSSLFTQSMKRFKRGVNWFEVDSALYTPISQGVVILKETPLSRAFYDFLLSSRAKEIFKEFGYIF